MIVLIIRWSLKKTDINISLNIQGAEGVSKDCLNPLSSGFITVTVGMLFHMNGEKCILLWD